MWIYLVFTVSTVLIFIAIVVQTYHLHFAKIYIAIGVLPFFCVTILLFILIKWNFFSEYPSTVQISKGTISLIFRKLFSTNRIISFSSQDKPSLLVDSHSIESVRFIYYYGRVRLYSNNNWPIIIYLKLYRTKEEAIRESMQIAEMIASQSGFRIGKDQI
jgi:hypothetical protein